ncbi:hypothetical protein [Sphingopyxis sp.]|jgi:hypothetical protein|uniref:hypothetical protein n=1 Tax=Sphingopyxis sp. TaxID=1908224 RepID=UPI00199F2D6A|nr:hypothetical protein [Sphingopyxis sp.]MBD3747509.1 hypothetical protein [Sphingopyxis terrae]
MRNQAIAIAIFGAVALASAPVSAGVVKPKQKVTEITSQQRPDISVGQANQPSYKPIAAKLAKTCSDSWWTMSGIQALTCLYMAAR